VVMSFNELKLTSAEFRTAYEKYKAYVASNGLTEKAVILCGFPKSGNTWLRFIYQNLVMLTHDAKITETLTYTKLNASQPNCDFPYALMRGEFCEPVSFDNSGFPMLFHSHGVPQPFWHEMGSVVFVYRNPLDTLLSTWYATVHFVPEARGTISMDDFVIQRLDEWCAIYLAGSKVADVNISYEEARANPETLIPNTFSRLEIDFDEALLRRAIEMSSLDSIRRMEDKYDQRHGHRVPNPKLGRPQPTPWVNEPDVRFCRSGESGQWRKGLKPETVDIAIEQLKKNDIDPGIWMIE